MRIVDALRITERVINNKRRSRHRWENRARKVMERMGRIYGVRITPERNLGRAQLKGK